jgi:hypothetical protein
MRSDGTGRTLVEGLQAHVRVSCARDGEWLRRVWAITTLVHAQEFRQLGLPALRCATRGGVVTGHDLDEQAAADLAAATGMARWRAEREVQAARRLCTVHVRTLEALEAGRVDGVRARVLAEETTGLPDAAALKVEAAVLGALPQVLPGVPVGPWDGPSPRAFTARVRKAVAEVRTDTEEQVRRELRERTGTWVQVDPANPTIATLTVTGPTEQVAAVADTLAVGARSLSPEELGGRTVGMAEVDLLHGAVCDGVMTGSDGTGQRELGVVVHVDTLVDEGEARHAAGEVRGVGAPVPATAAAVRVAAGDLLERGATTCVLLTDDTGHLLRLLRLGTAPDGRWTRAALVEATRRALRRRPEPKHHTDSYKPTVEIAETVAARDPVCTFPGCGVPTRRCDLDHTIPHPRGPTSAINLGPRSRRCHRYKTAALWRCRTRTDTAGRVVAHEWTSPLGVRQVVEVEPLPGCVTRSGS